MGKRKKVVGKKAGRSNGDHRDAPGYQAYHQLPRENQRFETYYKAQRVVADDEWDAFMAALRRPLPATFRVTAYKEQAAALMHVLRSDYFNDLFKVDLSEDMEDAPGELKLPSPVEWFPGGMAWRMDLPRRVIRKHPQLARLHSLLISENESGNITRQEEVSMVPALLLDVHPHHKILDMCAAPGSKTSQIIEMLHRDGHTLPKGLVVANDSDNQRCYMLVHQAKRLQSPSFLVTNHDARFMPNIYLPADPEQGRVSTGNEISGEGRPECTNPKETDDNCELYKLEYDRILCDAPCSGDGTLRKNFDIWKKWTPSNGRHMHNLQLQILRRGCELLRVGGRIIYSTCSLNPLENEAVVAEILTQCGPALKLVDVSQQLPGLKRSKGVTQWMVPSYLDADKLYSNHSEVSEDERTKTQKSMFPPENNASSLERCVRLLPHHLDSGGFFLAVLEKTAPLPWMSQSTTTVSNFENLTTEDTLDTKAEKQEAPPPKRKRHQYQGFKEDPYIFFDGDEPAWPSISKFYDVDEEFDSTLLLTRCKDSKKRSIYMTSSIVKALVTHNEKRVKIINTGVRVLSRSDKKGVACDFRLCQEGLQTWRHFMSRSSRNVPVSQTDAVTLLQEDNPFVTQLSQPTQEYLAKLSTGSIIFTFSQQNQPSPFSFAFCGWKGAVSARSFVARNERLHMLRLLGVVDPELEEPLEKVRQAKAAEQENVESVPEVLPENVAEGTCDSTPG